MYDKSQVPETFWVLSSLLFKDTIFITFCQFGINSTLIYTVVHKESELTLVEDGFRTRNASYVEVTVPRAVKSISIISIIFSKLLLRNSPKVRNLQVEVRELKN